MPRVRNLDQILNEKPIKSKKKESKKTKPKKPVKSHGKNEAEKKAKQKKLDEARKAIGLDPTKINKPSDLSNAERMKLRRANLVVVTTELTFEEKAILDKMQFDRKATSVQQVIRQLINEQKDNLN